MTTGTIPGVLNWLGSLSDQTRGRILLLLERGELTVTELGQVLQLPQPTVSRHLARLARDGWVTMRVDGRSRHYRISSELEGSARRLWLAVREELAETPESVEDRVRARSVLEARAERSRAFFASRAGRWDHLRRDLFGTRAELQLLPALVNPGEVVGDLGCGTGRLARLLSPFAHTVIALDRSPEMLEVARRRTRDFKNVQVREGELEALPFEDASLDVAILALVLHYVVDPEVALGELYRVLRPGGRLLVLDMQPHNRTAFREEMGHVWLGFSATELQGWLQGAGFVESTFAEVPADPDSSGPLLFTLRASRSKTPTTGGRTRSS